jgi:hypothetical protein
VSQDAAGEWQQQSMQAGPRGSNQQRRSKPRCLGWGYCASLEGPPSPPCTPLHTHHHHHRTHLECDAAGEGGQAVLQL